MGIENQYIQKVRHMDEDAKNELIVGLNIIYLLDYILQTRLIDTITVYKPITVKALDRSQMRLGIMTRMLP